MGPSNPPKHCPKCGCIELFAPDGVRKRQAVKKEQIGNNEYYAFQFYENYKTWRCANNKCRYQWDTITNRHTFINTDIYKMEREIKEGIIIYK